MAKMLNGGVNAAIEAQRWNAARERGDSIERCMSATEIGLALSVFLACAVEAVEALTIVMAVGYTRSWPSALAGAGTAAVVLAGLVAALGSAIAGLPIDTLRIGIGVVLLAVGLQWLRKAVLRCSRRKALHDEDAAYAREADAARSAGAAVADFDPYSFAVSLKGVLLEGFEIALIVLTFAANDKHIALAGASAGLAIAAVMAAGVAARSPLSRVPENTMKFAVGVMLSAYGVFWLGEGAGASWPAGDAALPAIGAAILGASCLAVAVLRRGAAVHD
jgi:uncharacterized membrane protein